MMPKYSYSLQLYSNLLLRTVNKYVIDIVKYYVVVPFIPNKNSVTLITLYIIFWCKMVQYHFLRACQTEFESPSFAGSRH